MRAVVAPSKRAMTATFLALALAACTSDPALQRAKLSPEEVRDGERRPPEGPEYPVGPGRAAVSAAALACFQQGLRHNDVFARGGAVVVRWHADANGYLLRVEFLRDSFRGWEVAETGETFAGCVVRRLRTPAEGEPEVLWSRTGTAPLRLTP